MPRPRYLSIYDRIFLRVKEVGGCWEWTGTRTPAGYSHVRIAGRMTPAHRVSYRLLRGPLGGMQIDHLCRNRACINPEHMELVTSKVNTLRGESFAGVNARKTQCPKDHPYDESNTYRDRRGYRFCRACWSDKKTG